MSNTQRPEITQGKPVSGAKEEQKGKRRRKHKESDAANWPEYTDIVAGGLRDQGILIRSLCRDVVQILELTLVTKEAWPELHRAAEYRVEVFTQAARALQATDIRYRELRKRINKDEDYAYTIGLWVSVSSYISFHMDAIEYVEQVADRLPLARGPARAHALNEIAVFQLGIGSECIARVKALFADKTYVYPGQWGTNAKGEVSFRPSGHQYTAI